MSYSSLLPNPDPDFLESVRTRFIAEIHDRRARGVSKQDFQSEVWNCAEKKRLICEGVPWLSSERAAEAYDDPAAFARDVQTHPWGVLTALEMWGDDFSVHDHEVIRITWMEERK